MTQLINCNLIGTIFENMIQLLLCIIALLSLYLKWYCESNKRKFKIFIFDCTKQILSGLFTQIFSIYLSIKFNTLINNTTQCSWFFIIFNCNVVLGTILCFLFLKLLSYIAKKKKI